LPEGLYKTRCRLPANFLNEKQYYLNVILVSLNPPIADADVRQVITFSVFDAGSMRTPGLSGSWLGVVRTPLAWQTTRLGDQ
jgi:hypothetical protein